MLHIFLNNFQELHFTLKIFNFLFTSVFIIEAVAKVIALGLLRYIKDRYVNLQILISSCQYNKLYRYTVYNFTGLTVIIYPLVAFSIYFVFNLNLNV